ncbi:EamA family transporter [Candidatus Woesearchaeota archaeon]|nr:EamA family transporter [Candidatus Woesearchaeota archaeon]
MQSWIYFVLIAYGIWAVTSLIDKIVISKGYIKSPLVYILLNGLMNVLLIFLLPFVGFEALKFTDFLIVLLGGAAFSASVSLYYKAVQYDDISKVIILFQLGPVFVLLMSFLFLGEILTKNSFIGFLFLLSAGFIVSYKKVNGSLRLGKAFYYMAISMFFGAIFLVTAKYIYNVTSFWSAFLWMRLAGFTALGVLLFPSIRKEAVNTLKIMKPKAKALMIFKMLIDFSAFVFLGYAILNGPISLVTVLGSSVLPLFVFVLALACSFYFPNLVKEDINKKAILIKLSAIALMVVGIVFVNLS